MKRKEPSEETVEEKEEKQPSESENKKPKLNDDNNKDTTEITPKLTEEGPSVEASENGNQQQQQKEELSEEEKEIKKAKIKKQIEFYFSDSNFPTDKFLKEESAKNPEGYIQLQLIATFNRVKNISTDMDLIKEALANSTELQMSEDKEHIKRVAPLPENDVSLPRTIFVTNYPTADLNVDTATAFFSQFGTVNAVRLQSFKKNQRHSYRGNLFVEFSSVEEVENILKKQNIIKDERKLYIKSKAQFLEDNKQRKEKRKREEEKGEGEEHKEHKERKERKEGKEGEEEAKKQKPFVITKGTIVSV